jgi:lipopolysaccharide biosynthesis glycosyltransferase
MGGHTGPPLQFVKYPDTDIGARRAKLAIYELAPQEWQQILYLDADTVLTAPVYALFDWIERGWEFVICRDLYPRDTLSSFQQRYDKAEVAEMIELLQTWEVQQLNGGVWSFCRSERTKVFFESWKEEYEKYCQRDQGALLRALYKHPLKMLVLGNEWNTFPKFQNGQVTAGILHYPQEARRWAGQIRGRIDGQEAWQAVKRFEAQDSRNGRGNRQ